MIHATAMGRIRIEPRGGIVEPRPRDVHWIGVLARTIEASGSSALLAGRLTSAGTKPYEGDFQCIAKAACLSLSPSFFPVARCRTRVTITRAPRRGLAPITTRRSSIGISPQRTIRDRCFHRSGSVPYVRRSACHGRRAIRCLGSRAPARRRKARFHRRHPMNRLATAQGTATKRRRTPILSSLMLALASALCPPSDASAAEPGGAPERAVTQSPPQSSDAIHYRVVIDAPGEFTDVIRNSVDLVRWQSYADMTEDLLDRLAHDAIDQAREAVSTLGYFTPAIDIEVDRKTDPITVTLLVKPGQPTRISDVSIVVTGPAADDGGAGAQAVADLIRDWGLPKGAIFRQSAWDSAKVRAVATLVASPYAAAKIVSSEARIDPAIREGVLNVTIDSGPAFRVGHLEITGLSRYSEAMVRNFSTIKPGDLYSAAALDQYLRRLNGTGYFASAQAAIDPDPAKADDATVRLALIEAPIKTFESGIGYSTDTEFR